MPSLWQLSPTLIGIRSWFADGAVEVMRTRLTDAIEFVRRDLNLRQWTVTVTRRWHAVVPRAIGTFASTAIETVRRTLIVDLARLIALQSLIDGIVVT